MKFDTFTIQLIGLSIILLLGIIVLLKRYKLVWLWMILVSAVLWVGILYATYQYINY